MIGPQTVVKQFHKEPLIPIQILRTTEGSKIDYLPNCLKLIYLSKGNLIVSINEKRYALIAPILLCLNDAEHFSVVEDKAAILTIFQFHPTYINKFLNYECIHSETTDLPVTTRQDIYLFKPFINRNDQYKGVVKLDSQSQNLIEPLINAIIAEIELQNHRFWSCMARSYCIELLFKILQITRSDMQIKANSLEGQDTLVESVVLYLQTKYPEKLTLETVSHHFGINRTSLQVRFRNVTGASVMQYLTQIRVHVASLLLKDTSLSVEEIAERTGFSDPSHFYKIFKKLEGEAPSHFRARLKRNTQLI